MDETSAAIGRARARHPGLRAPRAAAAALARGVRRRLALPLHQVRRALREPWRLSRLHHASVRASLRSLAEPDTSEFACALFGLAPSALRRFEAELLGDGAFARALEDRHRAVRGRAIHLLDDVPERDHDRLYRLLYYAVRALRPEVIVETGVFDGLGSAFLLKALGDNGRGRLCSIDLPARVPARASTDKMAFDALPPGEAPGWIVPDGLRPLWTLRLGRSEHLLEPWLRELGAIDLFVHDSLHTRAHMTFEYRAAWSALNEGGVLVSDDVFWSTAFRRFAREVGRPGRICRGVGFLRKPGRGTA